MPVFVPFYTSGELLTGLFAPVSDLTRAFVNRYHMIVFSVELIRISSRSFNLERDIEYAREQLEELRSMMHEEP